MTDPAYSVHDGVHTLTFPDGTRLVERHPHRDQRGGLWGKVDAYSEQSALLNSAQINLLDQRERQRLRTTVRRSMASWTGSRASPLRP